MLVVVEHAKFVLPDLMRPEGHDAVSIVRTGGDIDWSLFGRALVLTLQAGRELAELESEFGTRDVHDDIPLSFSLASIENWSISGDGVGGDVERTAPDMLLVPDDEH